jgi:hypothetical protein
VSLVHAFDLIVCYALDVNVLHHQLKVVVGMNPHGEQDSEEHEFFGSAAGYGSSRYTGLEFNSMAFTKHLHSQSASENAAGHVGSPSAQGASRGIHGLTGDEHFVDGHGTGQGGRGHGTATSGRDRGAAAGRGTVGARGGHSAAIDGGRGGRAGGCSDGGGRPPIPPYHVP